MLKFTFHSLNRARERDLSLDLIANQVMGALPEINSEKKRFQADGLTVVAKKEGGEVVVITAWKN